MKGTFYKLVFMKILKFCCAKEHLNKWKHKLHTGYNCLQTIYPTKGYHVEDNKNVQTQQ